MTKDDLRCSCSPPRTFPVKRKWDFHHQDRHAITGKMNIVNKAGQRETFELTRVNGVITCPRCSEPFEKKMNLRRHLMREDCMTEKRPEIFNPRPPRVTRNHEQGTSPSRETKTRSQGTRSSKRQALKAEERAQEEEEEDEDDYEEDEEDEEEEDEEEDEDEVDRKEEEEEEVMKNTDDLMDNPYHTEDHPYMFRTERVSLAEHERVIMEMRVNMKKMERIIEIQADQIERLEDTAADYIVFRDRLASLFGTGRGE
ncbi:hypothetical protein BG005_006754 [Podila minutissima]|nr:hypothetical protein BG005_006754 [Podila minutissima]